MPKKLFFVPSRHGYHFTNSFINRIFPGVIPGVSTGGLCGGMVMSALDYWRAGVPIPLHSSDTDDFGPTKLPDEASRMRRYIYDRQLHSLTTKLMASRWIVVGYGPNDFHEWATGSEFEIIKAQIRLGRPAILGLWSMDGDPLRGHQVLCYGYEDFTKKLYVYDPNRPDEESILEPISPEKGVEVKGTQKRTSATTYRGYFFADVYFWDQQPPYDPPYKDLVVSGELSISPQNPDNPTVGESLSCSVTISNIGEYPSRFKHLYIWVRDPQGNNVDNLLGGPERGITVLQPGESRTISRSSQEFGNITGTYTIGVSYLSNSNHWINIPPEYSSLKNTASITLWEPSQLAVDEWFDVSERTEGDTSTGIILQPGDEFQLTGKGLIWAGVWLTGLNGPEGWEDWLAEPGSPRTGIAPFSLIGRFEDESSYFLIGRELTRRQFPLDSPKQLMLKINDDTPNNGSGAFRCRVQVWRR